MRFFGIGLHHRCHHYSGAAYYVRDSVSENVRDAERFEVAGGVRHEPDGSVRCVVEGDVAQLDAFVAVVQDAMAGNVGDTRIRRGAARGELEGFGIRS